MSDVVRLDAIKTRPQNEDYRKGWDRIFGKKEEQKDREPSSIGDMMLELEEEIVGCPNQKQCSTPEMTALCYCSAKVRG